MKKQFQNLDIQCWRHSEKLGHSQPCICMQAGSEAIDTLLRAVEELAAEGAPNRRLLTLLPNQRPKPCTKIRLSLAPLTDDLREMSITRENGVAIFEFTEVGLTEFREAITVWRNGGEDFCIYPGGKKKELGSKDRVSGELWFWTPRTDP